MLFCLGLSCCSKGGLEFPDRLFPSNGSIIPAMKPGLGKVGSSGRNSLKFVAEGVQVPAFEAALRALTLPGFDQVFNAARPLGGRGAAFGAAFVPLHAELVFPLSRNLQVRELVCYSLIHLVSPACSTMGSPERRECSQAAFVFKSCHP
jgi:hypothetical protein